MLSSHPCSSEGVLLLPFGLADVDDVDVGCVLCVRLFVFFVYCVHALSKWRLSLGHSWL